VESLARYTSLYFKGDGTLVERQNILKTELKKLEIKQKEINDTIDRLQGKIENYDLLIKDANERLF